MQALQSCAPIPIISVILETEIHLFIFIFLFQPLQWVPCRMLTEREVEGFQIWQHNEDSPIGYIMDVDLSVPPDQHRQLS